ncbi:hypothetical protein H5187_08885 [Pseudoalteromonas sp. SG44-1]|uniref:hypothetical protein n=1 Tax=Pseudoalteromonas sp. SG44-1 TaxID=2760964 RepID=UPI001602E510|nr:hypothetical protein [Pseudoalteromonas sp. SG44-1]MBB1417390.1 hypothetical protein [Pseudoalteromonas sp. SG44-1]
MLTKKFTCLLKQLKQPHSSSLYIAYTDTLKQFDFDKQDATHQQWIEAWLESTPIKSIELTNQGIYVGITIREKILEKFAFILIDALKIENTATLPAAQNDIEKITELEIEAWLEFDSDWMITLLTAMFCKNMGIDSNYLDPYLNGRLSIYADSFNERLSLATIAIEFIESGEIPISDYEKILDFFGAFFILAFCEDDVLKQRVLNTVGDI